MSETMRALRLDRPGGKLVMEEIPRPRPGRGEVLVKMGASPINPSDLAVLDTGYMLENWPLTPGLEGSGMVVETGPGFLPSLRKGKRVACSPNPNSDGTWAEYMCTSVMRVSPLPNSLPMEQGAMMLVNPMTAMALLREAREGRHPALVNNAAGSSLGKMLIRLCKEQEIPLINIVRKESAIAELTALGAEHVLNSSDPLFKEKLKELCTTLNATLILDAVGGKDGGKLLEAAPRGARLLEYARLSGEALELDTAGLIRLEKSVHGFQLANWLHGKKLMEKLRFLKLVKKAMGSSLSSHIAATYALEEAREAITRYRQHMSEGKILLVPDPSIK